MTSKIYQISFVLISLLCFGCKQNLNLQQSKSCPAGSLLPQKHEIINYNIPVSKLVDSLNIDLKNIHILIEKNEYLLSILCDTLLIKQFPVVFGANPIDDKLREGDCCTPEGNFSVVTKYAHNKWSRFILINYPNQESWLKFNEAVSNDVIPSDSHIGGAIGIHGVPEGADYAIDIRDNWTLGCISLKNNDINEIYDIIGINTPVIIRK